MGSRGLRWSLRGRPPRGLGYQPYKMGGARGIGVSVGGCFLLVGSWRGHGARGSGLATGQLLVGCIRIVPAGWHDARAALRFANLVAAAMAAHPLDVGCPRQRAGIWLYGQRFGGVVEAACHHALTCPVPRTKYL